jgi:O-antigen/teichoic acid export membrane protein
MSAALHLILTRSEASKMAQRYRALAIALAKSGAGSIASGLLSAAAMKLVAIFGGPIAVAQLATLQQLRQVGVVAATMNGQTALVQGTSSIEGSRRRTYLGTVATLFFGASLFVSAGMIAFPGMVVRWAGLPTAVLGTTRWLAVPVLLTSGFVFISALLNSLGEIGGLATAQVAASGTFLTAVYVVTRWSDPLRASGLLWSMGISAAASLMVAGYLLTKNSATLREWLRGPEPWWAWWAIRRFFSVSAVMFATGWIGSLALVTVRANIVAHQGANTLGQFDAAWTLSMTQATLVLASMQNYYLPTLSRCRTREERTRHVADAMTLVPLVAVGLIVVLIALKPFVLSALYSTKFSGAATYLRWTLIGDYLKVGSWILSMPMIAAGQMTAFLWLDVAAYATFLAASFWLGVQGTAAEAAALAFALMYVVHFSSSLGWGLASGRFGLRSGACIAWLTGLAAVGAASVLFWEL